MHPLPTKSSRYTCFFVVLLLATFYHSRAQHRVSGYVEDATTGEKLFGATIAIEGTTQGVVSNFYGFYSLIVPPGATLVYSYVGYSSFRQAINAAEDISITARLEPRILDEVIIEGNQEEKARSSPLKSARSSFQPNS